MAENKEIIIQNLTQVNEVLSTIKAGFENEQNEPVSYVIRFDNGITVEDLTASLAKLWQYEVDSNHTIDILIKNLSYEHRKEALRLALKTPNLVNNTFLMNVFCLVRQSNTFEESYFEHPQVFMNDEVELLDTLDNLETEILEVMKNVAEYYVSMLKTCHMVDAVENNPNAVKLDNMYQFLFSCLDVTMLAKILSSVKDSSVWETKKIVLNSLNYLGAIAEKFVFTNSVLNLLFSSDKE